MGSWQLDLKLGTSAKMIRYLLIFSAICYLTDALSCVPCGNSPCEIPKCCPSGKLTTDVCGCCPVCAKGPNEECGGPWYTTGHCVAGLNCLKECKCTATFVNKNQIEKQKVCAFPFKYKGKTYDKCTRDGSENGKPWCAFKVDRRTREAKTGKWADCDSGCPGTEYECGEFDLQQMDGRCVVEKEAEVKLQRSSNVYSIEENFVTTNNFTKRCPPGSKDYNRCQCTENLRPQELREPGENCEAIGEGDYGGSSGWCFLEDVSNPNNPSENCFEDASWSQTNGRFFSSYACGGAPDYASYDDQPSIPPLDYENDPSIPPPDPPIIIEE